MPDVKPGHGLTRVLSFPQPSGWRDQVTAFIGRREFITLLGGAAAVWPVAVRAQQAQPMRRIGILDTLAADDPEASIRHGAFMQGLQKLGWTLGRNLRMDVRWAAADVGRARNVAAEIVDLGPEVIFTSGFSTIRPLLDATRTLPIVFANVVDPVGAGFVASGLSDFF